MKISLIVEGKTEQAFKPHLIEFLSPRLPNRMPKLDPLPYDGRIPKEGKLKRLVENLLSGRVPADAVIALTDVYTGSNDFSTASDAKEKMRTWVGFNPKFYPHAAQHDFEAWLIPYWPRIQQLAGHNKTSPGDRPEQVNHADPPAHRIADLFRIGTKGKAYVKPRDAGRILQGQDILLSANACPELKAFLNTTTPHGS